MARVKCLVCVRFTCVTYFFFPLSPSRLFPSLFIYVTPGFHGPMCRPMLLLTGGMWRCRGAFQTVPSLVSPRASSPSYFPALFSRPMSQYTLVYTFQP